MSKVNYLITDKTLTFYVGGQPYAIDRNAAAFDGVKSELNKPDPDVQKLIDLADSVKVISQQITAAQKSDKFKNYLPKGVISVTREGVTFDGEVVQNALADRLMDILSVGLRMGPWIRFAENVFMNPAEYAREELYEWLSGSDLPITDDGCFLAYKVVRDDYKDVYSGTFDNSVGQVVQLTGRDKVDADRNNHCSRGLHFCSKEYLPHFGVNSSGRRVMLVKINPADVVSIPNDYNFTKGRTWRYEVVDEIADVPGITDRTWSPIVDDYSDYSDDDDDYDDYDEEVMDDEGFPASDYDARLAELMEEGIVTLRRMASNAGLNSTLAWKVYSKEQLAGYIASA